MVKTAVLCACIVFLSLAATPVHAADKPLQLNVTLEKINTTVYEGKNYLSAEIKATFTNKSSKDRTFYLEDCGICFWQASINGGRYNPIKDARHERFCDCRNSVTLKQGKSISRKIYVSLSDISRESDLKTIKILYSGAKEAKDRLESNTLKI